MRVAAPTHTCSGTPLPSAWCADVGIALHLKDETTHITGSLKPRSLFLYVLRNGGSTTGPVV